MCTVGVSTPLEKVFSYFPALRRSAAAQDTSSEQLQFLKIVGPRVCVEG